MDAHGYVLHLLAWSAGDDSMAGALPSVLYALTAGTAAARRLSPLPPQAVLVLEAAQVQRKVSAPLRLAATALYSLAGAPRQAAASLSALDVKYILHDTLTGHWLLPALVGGAAEAADLRK